MTIDKDRLRALAEAATPGPWFVSGGWITSSKVNIADFSWAWDNVADQPHMAADDLRYIAAVHPQAVLALLDRADRQSALCAALATHLDNLQHWTTLPDDAVILESRSTDGRGELKITAGMIRMANGGERP